MESTSYLLSVPASSTGHTSKAKQEENQSFSKHVMDLLYSDRPIFGG